MTRVGHLLDVQSQASNTELVVLTRNAARASHFKEDVSPVNVDVPMGTRVASFLFNISFDNDNYSKCRCVHKYNPGDEDAGVFSTSDRNPYHAMSLGTVVSLILSKIETYPWLSDESHASTATFRHHSSCLW